MKTPQKGFTLIELAVVIAIVAILAAVAIPRFANTTATAECAMVKDLVSQMTSASAMYTAEQAATPTGFDQFVTTNTALASPFTLSLANFGSGVGNCVVGANSVNCDTRLKYYAPQYSFNAGGVITLTRPVAAKGGVANVPVCQ